MDLQVPAGLPTSHQSLGMIPTRNIFSGLNRSEGGEIQTHQIKSSDTSPLSCYLISVWIEPIFIEVEDQPIFIGVIRTEKKIFAIRTEEISKVIRIPYIVNFSIHRRVRGEGVLKMRLNLRTIMHPGNPVFLKSW